MIESTEKDKARPASDHQQQDLQGASGEAWGKVQPFVTLEMGTLVGLPHLLNSS